MDYVIESVSGLELTRNVKDHLEFTYADYQDFLEELFKLDDKTLKIFLKTLKDRELVNNQETELEDSFLIELYKYHQRKDSIEIVTGLFQDDIITIEELKKLHRVVIKGSSDDNPKNYAYRTDNDKWVGSYGTNGDMCVDYYPPDYNDVINLISITLDILNNDTKDDSLGHMLIKPFIVHGLIAYIQPFGNGNTRLSRVLQHGKIWQMTNDKLGTNLSLPALYLSKNYLQTRPQYRKLIRQIATEQNWNAWLDYNLNMVDEQLYFSQDKLRKVRQMF